MDRTASFGPARVVHREVLDAASFDEELAEVLALAHPWPWPAAAPMPHDAQIQVLDAAGNILMSTGVPEWPPPAAGVEEGVAVVPRLSLRVRARGALVDALPIPACGSRTPIYHPATGEPAGAVTSPGRQEQTRLGPLVAQLIEREWQLQIARRAALVNDFRDRLGLPVDGQFLGFDRWGLPVVAGVGAQRDAGRSRTVDERLRAAVRSAVLEVEAMPASCFQRTLPLEGEAIRANWFAVIADGRVDGFLVQLPPAQDLTPPETGGGIHPRAVRVVGLARGRLMVIDQTALVWATMAEGRLVLSTRDARYASTFPTLEQLTEVLSSPPFVQINRSTVVNVAEVREIVAVASSIDVVMGDQAATVLPVSRRRVPNLRQHVHF
jgi:hypothetical protein